MTTLDVVSLAVGVLGLAAAARFYYELWKWARQCQNAKIAIANKGKVQLTASLLEWLTWANALNAQEARGRVVYRNAKVSVAILRAPKSYRLRSAIGRVRGARRHRKPQDPPTINAQQN